MRENIRKDKCVNRALKDKQGYPLHNVAFFGESAGGLALRGVLKMRDRAMTMPAAVVALSPVDSKWRNVFYTKRS